MTAVLTPSPYLRDRLMAAVDGLRRDAETAHLNLAEAEQDVAAARQLLAEAEAQERAARAAVDGIAEGIAWAQDRAREITAQIDAAAAAHAAAVRHVREEPTPVPYAEHIGHRVDVLTTDLERTRGHLVRIANGWLTLRACGGEMSIPDEQVRHVARAEGSLELEPDDDAPSTAARAPGQVNAALTGTVAPPVPHDPAMTIPDTGLSPDPLPPAEDAAQPRHAKPPRRIDVSGAFKAITGRLTADDQDGDRHE